MTIIFLIGGPRDGDKVVICWTPDDPELAIAEEIPLYVQTREGVCHYALTFDAESAVGGDGRARFVDFCEW